MIALSTSIFGDTPGPMIIEALGGIDIKLLELNFTLSPEQVSDIIAGTRQLGIAISSLHNFVPEPPDGERTAMLSDIDEQSRKRAISLTEDTIRLASELGAGAVVLHMGQPRGVELNDMQRALRKAIHAKVPETEISKIRSELINARKRLPGAYLDSMLLSLEVIAVTAERMGIKLGVESRYFYSQFPDFEELGILLQEFAGSNIGYWHDCGHTQHTQFCGLGSTAEYLEAFGRRLVGVHLHDTHIWTDHQIPGPNGDLDFGQIKPYLTPDTIRVMELSKKCPLDEVNSGIDYLRKIGLE
jgi:sugar phosphate isomerase/epimerase